MPIIVKFRKANDNIYIAERISTAILSAFSILREEEGDEIWCSGNDRADRIYRG